MQVKSICIDYYEYTKGQELDRERLDLLEKALLACQHAYAPYSRFYVGSAILFHDAKVITGTNQENASYPCGICAERAALFSIGTIQPKANIKKMAITVQNSLPSELLPAMPCGLCRQVMVEFENNNETPIELIIGHPEYRTFVFRSCADLLPFSFNGKILINKN